MTATSTPPRSAGTATGPLARLVRMLEHPAGLYHLLLGATLLLLLLGVVMVLSASSILSLRQDGSVYTIAQRQALFAAGGLVAMAAATRVPIPLWRKCAWPLMLLSLALLVAVLIPGIGAEAMGQRNWIDLGGPVRLQPAEFAKFSLALWSAHVLTRRGAPPTTWRELLMPVVPMTCAVIGLVLLGGDFGNVVMLAAIMAGVLFAAGAPARFFLGMFVVGGVGVAALSFIAPHRIARFGAWLNPSADPLGDAYQLTQGQYALGTGGWFGVGLGASREKWGSLPEAHTDFIFSVVGEELGLVGTLALLLVFGLVTVAIFRLATIASSMFVRLAAAGVGSWLVVQAVVNIGGVLGLLPIAGVTLPLVSYGGSSLIPTLVALGMLMSFARSESTNKAS